MYVQPIDVNILTAGITQPITDTQLRATPVPISGTIAVTGTFWQATQPISVASLPLPTGAATEATLSTLNGKIPSGLAVSSGRLQVELPAGGGGLTDGELRASPIDVAIASIGLPTGASTAALQTTGNSSLSSIDTKIPALGQALAAASVPVVLTTAQISTLTPQTNALTDAQLRAVAVPVSGTFWQATQPVSIASLPALAAGTNNIGDVDVLSLPALPAGNNNIGDVDIASIAAGTNRIGSVRMVDSSDADLTTIKGTQASRAVHVLSITDGGRVPINFYATAAAAGATTVQTAITLTKSAGTGATSSAASFVVTSGKRFRITHLSVATRGHNTGTAQVTTFNLRINTAGAVTTASTPIIFSARSATPATANAWDRYIIPIPEGLEILGDGTLQFGITAAATYTTNAPTWDVNIIGYEY